MNPSEIPRCGLVLSGGGARGAYQAGVLNALAEIAAAPGHAEPFRILTGASAGAINATYLASRESDWVTSTGSLLEVWATMTSKQVIRVGGGSLMKDGAKLLINLVFGGLRRGRPKRNASLLNTEPLGRLIKSHTGPRLIRHNLEEGRLDAVAITAVDYQTAVGVTFVQGRPGMPTWKRSKRIGIRAELTPAHVMASSSIPIFFPPVRIRERFFGDGCLRNTAPLSPAIHLGAERLIVIGVRKKRDVIPDMGAATNEPGMGKILTNVINSVFMDAVEADIERLNRVNHLLAAVPGHELRDDSQLKEVGLIYIRPSRDLAEIAAEEAHHLPRPLSYLVGGLGNVEQTRDLISYLLFEGAYCRRLAELGYRDCYAREEEIRLLLTSSKVILPQ